eukprot:776375-Prymnesium_polylepis.3
MQALWGYFGAVSRRLKERGLRHLRLCAVVRFARTVHPHLCRDPLLAVRPDRLATLQRRRRRPPCQVLVTACAGAECAARGGQQVGGFTGAGFGRRDYNGVSGARPHSADQKSRDVLHARSPHVSRSSEAGSRLCAVCAGGDADGGAPGVQILANS